MFKETKDTKLAEMFYKKNKKCLWFYLSSLSGPSKNCQSENETRLVPKAGNWSSFQSAIIAARYSLIAYDIATAQS